VTEPTTRTALLVAAGGLAGAGYLLVADPHDPAALMPRCPTKLVTGLDCPACGGLRLAHDLLRADLGAAVHDNPFLLACAPALAFLAVERLRAARAGAPAPPRRRLAYGLAGAALAWMVMRNLPGWPLKPTLDA
jgi:Protein of unknown function (DUF2752)